MDPTTVLPPSPQKSPPPQNPHTATDAMIDASAFNLHQKSEPSTSRNMDNFRALVMKLTGRLLPAHQSLIVRRFDDIFPDELLVPDHPPYADMILTALWELNAEGGSSEEAILDFIEKEYHELPWAHATLLNHHLRDLCMKGKIVMTRDRCYLRCSSITKPVPSPSPSPCHHLCLNDDSSCSSPISSSYSSSSASLCSSPSSSSSSICLGPPYKRHNRQLKRKRKNNIKETECKMVQVQVGQRGRSRGMIQEKRQGRPGKEVKIGEKTQMEEEQVDDLVVENISKLEEPKLVTEDQNEVMGMEVEEDAIQDGDLYDVMSRIDQQGQLDGAVKQQNQPQKKNNAVVETTLSVEDQTKVIIDQKVGREWNGNVKEKGESVGLRRSGRMKIVVDEEETLPSEQYKVGDNEQYQPQKKHDVTWIGPGECIKGKEERVKLKRSGNKQHVSKETFQPCEQLDEGINEQGRQRKQYNVVWIGRGVRKLKEAGKNLLEAESDEEVTELEDYVCEDAVMINSDAEVDEHVEQLKQKEEKGATNVEHNQPEENKQSDIVEKQSLEKEQLMSVLDDKILPWEQHERVDTEAELQVAEKLHLKHQLCNEILPETLQVDDKVKEDQYLLMARSEGQEVGVVKECNQVEGESMEQIGSQLQQNDLSGEQVDLQKQSKEETDCKFHTQGQQQRGSMEKDQLQKQEDRLGDEQDSVMMQCEAQVTDATVEEQHDDTNEEQIRPEEQPKKGTEEEFETHEQQNDGGTEPKMLETQVQMVGKPLQDEEIQKGKLLIDKERDALMIQYEAQARVETVEKTQPEEQHDCLTEEQVDTKEQSKEHDDATEEPFHPQECIERTEDEIQSCGPDWLKNGEAESSEKQPQQEEQQTEVYQKEIGLAMDSEVQEDLRMNQGEIDVGRACVIQNESQERQHVAEKHVQPQEHCMGGNKFQLHMQQQRDVMKQVHQSEECKNGVRVQRYQPLECVERIEERSQPCIQQIEVSEKDALQEKNNAVSNENFASSSSTIEVSGAFLCKPIGVVKVNIPDHKHQDEQRRPLRQGLRSSCKKEEVTAKAKNQLERATPVRRSLRPRKTISEATVVIENGPDRSKEQLKQSGRARPSKRKPGIAEAEQVSKSQKTRRTDL